MATSVGAKLAAALRALDQLARPARAARPTATAAPADLRALVHRLGEPAILGHHPGRVGHELDEPLPAGRRPRARAARARRGPSKRVLRERLEQVAPWSGSGDRRCRRRPRHRRAISSICASSPCSANCAAGRLAAPCSRLRRASARWARGCRFRRADRRICDGPHTNGTRIPYSYPETGTQIPIIRQQQGTTGEQRMTAAQEFERRRVDRAGAAVRGAVRRRPRRLDRQRRPADDRRRRSPSPRTTSRGSSTPTCSPSAASCCSAAGSPTCSAAGGCSWPAWSLFALASLAGGFAEHRGRR